MAVSYTIRQATTTNTVSHQLVLGTTYQVARYFNRFDLTSWDEASSANFNGTTEDGSILVSWAVGDTPPDMKS